jgi:hypothetical protein
MTTTTTLAERSPLLLAVLVAAALLSACTPEPTELPGEYVLELSDGTKVVWHLNDDGSFKSEGSQPWAAEGTWTFDAQSGCLSIRTTHTSLICGPHKALPGIAIPVDEDKGWVFFKRRRARQRLATP